MTATARQFVDLLLSQDGDAYIFGHEVSLSDTNPAAFDCSELVQWGCARLGVTPTMPDGSWYQARHCRNNDTLVPVAEGESTLGALLFRFSSSPFSGGRPTSAHVAVSQGNGKTIEARGTRYGVGQFSVIGRGWTHAARVPGLTYLTGDDDMPLTADDIKAIWKAAPIDEIAKKVWYFLITDDVTGAQRGAAFHLAQARRASYEAANASTSGSGLTPGQLDDVSNGIANRVADILAERLKT